MTTAPAINTPDQVLSHGEALVWGFTGWGGMGKSLSACGLFYQYRDAGYNCYHNGPAKFGELLDWHKLVTLEYHDCVIWIDEIDLTMDPRRSNTLFNVEASHFLVQRRKRNVNLIWTTHLEELVDTRLRWQTDMFVRCYTEDGGENIVCTVTDKMGKFNEAGTQRKWLMSDAWRYWDLYDANDLRPVAMGQYDKKSKEEARRMEEMASVIKACISLYQNGVEVAASVDISRAQKELNIMQMSPQFIGQTLSKLGYSSRKHADRRVYPIPVIANDAIGGNLIDIGGAFESSVSHSQNGGSPMDSEVDPTPQIAPELAQDSPADRSLMEEYMDYIPESGADLKAFSQMWADAGLDPRRLESLAIAKGMRIEGGKIYR